MTSVAENVRRTPDVIGTGHATQTLLADGREAPLPLRPADFTHWRLVSGTDTEILSLLDGHSRYALSVTAHRRVSMFISE